MLLRWSSDDATAGSSEQRRPEAQLARAYSPPVGGAIWPTRYVFDEDARQPFAFDFHAR